MMSTKPVMSLIRPGLVVLCGVMLWTILAACSASPERHEDEDVQFGAHDLEDSEILPVADSPIRGPKNAWVTVVVFADFQCPFCAQLAATLSSVNEAFSDDTVRLVFKHHPLEIHDGARRAALAAEAAREQNLFWEMHDGLFDDFARLSADDPEWAVVKIAEKVGVDVEQLKVDMERDEIVGRVEEDLRLAETLGLHGVPAVYVNGGLIPGVQSPETYVLTIVEVRTILEESVARDEIGPHQVYRKSVETLYSQP